MKNIAEVQRRENEKLKEKRERERVRRARSRGIEERMVEPEVKKWKTERKKNKMHKIKVKEM